MNPRKAITQANSLLVSEYGHSPYSPDLGNLAWGFSEPDEYEPPGAPLWWIGPLYSPEGEPVMDFRCSCGLNRSIHSSDCSGLTAATIRMGKQKSAPFHRRSWLLGKWIPPPPEEEWAAIDGSMESYPRRGRFEPMSVNGRLVSIDEEKYADLPEKTRKIIVILKDFVANKKAMLAMEDERQSLREWRPPKLASGSFDFQYQPGGLPGSKHNENFLRFRDRMTQFGQTPGKKQHVSFGGVDLETEKSIIVP